MLTPAGNQPGIPPEVAELRSTAAATLLALLSGGDEVSGRVVGNLGGNTWAITVRGRTLVAESAVPLTPDTVVKLALQTMSDGEVRVRLAESQTAGSQKAEPANMPPQPMATAAFARLASLGLPASPAALLVLAAFEEAGAPLEPERLRTAIMQVATTSKPETPVASDNRPRPDAPPSAGGRPPPSVPGLPISPLVTNDHAAASARVVSAPVVQAPRSSAEESIRLVATTNSNVAPKATPTASVPLESLPPPAARIAQDVPKQASPANVRLGPAAVVTTASQAVPQVTQQVFPRAISQATPSVQTAAAVPISPPTAVVAESVVADAPPRSPLTTSAAVTLAPLTRSSPDAVGSSVRPTEVPVFVSSSPRAAAIPKETLLAPDPQRVVVSARALGSPSGVVATSVAVDLPQRTEVALPRPDIVDVTRTAVRTPGVPAVLAAPNQEAPLEPMSPQRLATAHARLAAADLPATPALVRLALTAQGPGLPQLAAAMQRIPGTLSRLLPTLSPAQAALVTAAAAQVPSVADLADGPPAAERALAQVGLRPAAEPVQAEVSTPTLSPSTERPLLRALAELAVALREAEATATPHEPRSAASEAVTRTVREAMAEQVFKPKDLADYDRVVPLPLAADGRPLPARVAVASRQGANGERATWVRIDAELTHLGAVSVRLSGGAGGPIAITLVAEPGPAQELIAGLPDLVEDLSKRGLIAAVRVATPDEVVHG